MGRPDAELDAGIAPEHGVDVCVLCTRDADRAEYVVNLPVATGVGPVLRRGARVGLGRGVAREATETLELARGEIEVSAPKDRRTSKRRQRDHAVGLLELLSRVFGIPRGQVGRAAPELRARAATQDARVSSGLVPWVLRLVLALAPLVSPVRVHRGAVLAAL